MPYTGPGDPKLPDYVQQLPEEKRRQWVAVFNEVLDDTGDEGQAIAAANAAVKAVLDSAPLLRFTEDGTHVWSVDGETWQPCNADAIKALDTGDRIIAFGGGIKTLNDEGRVGGHLVLWGDATKRDLQGEFFTPDSDLALDWYPTRPLLYHHGLDKGIGPSKIGEITVLHTDDLGVWMEAQIDRRHRYAGVVMELAQQGVLGLSSGTLPHLAAIEKNGHIRFWPVVEGSLTPTPAEPRISVVTLKSLYSLPSLEGLATKADVQIDTTPMSDHETLSSETADDGSPSSQEDTEMNLQELITSVVTQMAEALGVELSEDQQATVMLAVQQTLADQITGLLGGDNGQTPDDEEAEVPAEAAEEFAQTVAETAAKAIQGVLQQQQIAATAAKAAAGVAATFQPQSRAPLGIQTDPMAHIIVRSKFADLSGADMAFFMDIMSQQRGGYAASQPFLREMADKVIAEEKKGGYPYLPREDDGSIKAMKAIMAIHKLGGMKTDEVMGPGQTGYGAEWIADLWATELWRKTRLANRVLSVLPITDMPSDPFKVPISGADPTVYRVATTEDDSQLDPSGSPVPPSKAGTDKKQLESHKMGCRVPWAEEEDEDNIIPFVAELRTQVLEAMEDALEYVVLQADTTTGTGNINKYDATVNTTDDDRWLLGFDGIAHLPLVTNTDLLIDHLGAAPTLALLRGLRKKLKIEYIGDLDNLVYFTDPITATALLDMPQVVTLDKYGAQATVLTGEIAKVDNIPIVQTDQQGLADDNGMISNTPANNEFGRIQLVWRPGWRVGYRRRVKATLVPLPLADAAVIVCFVRVALINYDNYCASMGVNILV